MESYEKQFNEQEQVKLPEWAGEIKVSYDAWRNDYEAMKQELGERKGLIGDVHRRESVKVNTVLYNALRTIDDLPEYVPLGREERSEVQAGLDADGKTISFSIRKRPGEEKYFLPKTYEICERTPYSRMKEEEFDLYSPEGKHFVGFEGVKQAYEEKGHKAYFYVFTDITPPSMDVLEHERRVLAYSSNANTVDRSAAQKAQGHRDYSSLQLEQIDEIIAHLQENASDQRVHEMLEKAKQDVDALEEKFPEEIKRAERLIAERIRRRIINLVGFLEDRFKKDLPASIDIMHTEREGGEKKSGHFFLPREKRLVNVPYKKGFFGGELKPDFSKATDDPEEEWLRAGLLGDMLIDIFPYEIRQVIKRQVR